MTQTWAIFVESYRSLNAKKLFWFVLALSALAVLAFAGLGINPDGLKILIWQWDSKTFNSQSFPPADFYKIMFVHFGIGFWLSWLAAILALVSTAGIFPDLIASGSIDLVVSKPIGRLRLFATQYAAGLLFVALQVTVFSMASFLVLGCRGGVWEPGLFLAVPLVVCFFSYLFSVCVLLGLLTRSTVASLLLTLLFWFVVFLFGTAEQTLLMFETMGQHEVSWNDLQAESQNRGNGRLQGPAEEETPEEEPGAKKNDPRWIERAHDAAYVVKTILPKTQETVGLLERWLIDVADLPDPPGPQPNPRMLDVQMEVVETIRGRSVAWVVGTSLMFETVILAFGAFIFCRRDF